MSAPKTQRSTKQSAASAGEVAGTNEVRLVGRLSRPPEERVLPSGDTLWTFRVVVGRPDGGPSRQSVDALDCTAWSPRARRSVSRWSQDDVVEVVGALRRRFFQTGSGSASRVEVEMASGRLMRRAANG